MTFDQVWGYLHSNGWLVPSKLRTLSEPDVGHLLKLTLETQGGKSKS